MNALLKPLHLFFLFCFSLSGLMAQSARTPQKGLLWQVSGNGLKKPSYVYGTMHVSQKIAFHLGDSFYLALAKCDVVALEQDLDSVIHRWITETDYDNPEDASRVFPRNSFDFLTLSSFTLNSYNKKLIQRKLSAEVREVNYLLTRGEQGDFEEDTWLDLYIYQLAKKLGKGFTGVEGYEESRDLVKTAGKEPKDSKDKKKKNFRANYRLRQQIADAYRRGDIYLLDSIDRMTESEHYLEYMLYRRNANMVRRMDSIMRSGKTLFTGVGCSHLPGSKGVLQMLQDKGYTLRPVQSIALEKSKLAKKLESRQVRHKYSQQSSEDGLVSGRLPARLTRVSNNTFYTSYLCPDLANGYYYQIEKISCNTVFSGRTPQDILLAIDTMIFENIPGEISEKKNIVSNGFDGIEVITRLKTGDLNRFRILASPFNVYIIRMAGKKDFAASSDADEFFRTLRISEGKTGMRRIISSPDSTFSLELPAEGNTVKLGMPEKANPSFEHLVYDRENGNTYLIKQEDILNEHYLEHDSFELNVMARSFAATDRYKTLNQRHFIWQGYNAKDAEYENKNGHRLYARFVISGTKYIMFVLKPNGSSAGFDNPFFNSIRFNGKPKWQYFEYADTGLYFKVKTPVVPLHTRKNNEYNAYMTMFGQADEEDKESQYVGSFRSVYLKPLNTNEFISISAYRYGYYESQNKSPEDYFKSWEKEGSLKLCGRKSETRNGIRYETYTYTDTNTTRMFRAMHVLHGKMRYYVEAYLDSVSGPSEFAETVFNSFDVSDTLLEENIFHKKGFRFFADFSGKDSAARKASVKHFTELSFGREDIRDLCNAIDSISPKSDAYSLRLPMISALSGIDSAQERIVPYLQKLYNRFSDTAHMQIEILKAIAMQKSENAFKAIKPILAQDVPISDNPEEMQQMLLFFGDSLKLARIILPELIELTGINEYRHTAYSILSRLKDSGIISENDYATIHGKLEKETRIEYKRMMASLTKSGNNQGGTGFMPDFGYNIQTGNIAGGSGYGSDYYTVPDGDVYSLLSDILDLSLPLLPKSPALQEIVGKIKRITDRECRLALLPVMLKYKVHFHDTVYEALASAAASRNAFYKILDKAGQLQLFPARYKNHRQWIMSELYGSEDESTHVDSVVFVSTHPVYLGKDTGLVYACKVKLQESEDWILYLSDAFPTDSLRLNTHLKPLLFEAKIATLGPDENEQDLIDNLLFDNLLKYTRQRNGGYYYSNYSAAGRYNAGSNAAWDY